MKKVLFVFSCCALFAACSNSENQVEGEEYYNNSTSEAEMSAATRQSEVDTSINDIGTDRTATVPAATDATATDEAATTTSGAAATTTGAAATNAPAAAQTKPAAGDDFEKGKNLIAMSDCLACHQVDNKLVGPAYQEVAAKYEMNDKNLNYLAEKIIKGGAGVWGQIPMTPHPDLKKEDAQEMAKYILSLRK